MLRKLTQLNELMNRKSSYRPFRPSSDRTLDAFVATQFVIDASGARAHFSLTSGIPVDLLIAMTVID
jgi:hypothetical protein